jgi:excinuclease UvrABC helicase subunit UvrB
VGEIQKARQKAVKDLVELDLSAFGGDKKKLIKEKRRQMHEAADNLDFETATLLRDEIVQLEKGVKKRASAAKKRK